MASMISSERKDEHIVISLKVDMKEYSRLKGAMNDIHLIPEEHLDSKSSIYERGKKGNTKYFLIPRCIRENKVISKSDVFCMCQDLGTKLLWTFILNKK